MQDDSRALASSLFSELSPLLKHKKDPSLYIDLLIRLWESHH